MHWPPSGAAWTLAQGATTPARGVACRTASESRWCTVTASGDVTPDGEPARDRQRQRRDRARRHPGQPRPAAARRPDPRRQPASGPAPGRSTSATGRRRRAASTAGCPNPVLDTSRVRRRQRHRDLERLLSALLRRRAAAVRPALRPARAHLLLRAQLRGVRELLPVVARRASGRPDPPDPAPRARHPLPRALRRRRRTATPFYLVRDTGVVHGTGNWVFVSGDACGVQRRAAAAPTTGAASPVDAHGASRAARRGRAGSLGPVRGGSRSILPPGMARGTCRSFTAFARRSRRLRRTARRATSARARRSRAGTGGGAYGQGAGTADPRGRRVALVVPGTPARSSASCVRRLDAAAGVGDPRRRLRQRPQHGRPRRATAPSPGSRSPTRASSGRAGAASARSCRGRSPRRRSPDDRFDFAVCLDVLEHIDDELHALRELHRVVRPGGTLLVTVPAYQSLWSEHDVINHHKRRYTRRDAVGGRRRGGLADRLDHLLQRLPAAGGGHASPPLAPAPLGRRAGVGPRAHARCGSNSLLELPLRVEAWLIGHGWRIPAGLSLMAVLRKGAATGSIDLRSPAVVRCAAASAASCCGACGFELAGAADSPPGPRRPPSPSGRRRGRWRPRPEHAALGAILVLSGLLEFVRLSQNGFANAFYSAAVKSMLRSLAPLLLRRLRPERLHHRRQAAAGALAAGAEREAVRLRAAQPADPGGDLRGARGRAAVPDRGAAVRSARRAGERARAGRVPVVRRRRRATTASTRC